MYTIYKVQEGDTLASVANKFGILASDLSNLNGIMVGSLLTPGDYIVVPKGNDENMYFQKYTIKDGDTMYGISRRLGINPDSLLRLNGLNDGDTIYPGEQIFIPRDGVTFYVTLPDDTMSKVLRNFGVSANDLVRQNDTIYLTNDQLIVYKK